MATKTTDSDLYVLLDRTVCAVRDLGWNIVVLVLRDEIAHTTYPVAAATTDPALRAVFLDAPPVSIQADPWRQDRFRISRSFFADHRRYDPGQAWASEAGQGFLPLDLDERADGEWQSGDFLIVPLEIEDRELGWLVVYDPADRRPPTPERVRALEVFADQAALTIRQVRLYQQVRAQASRQVVLNEIAHTISQHLEMADLFYAITHQLQQVFYFQRASITLREGPRPHAQVLIWNKHAGAQIDSGAPTVLEDIAFRQIVQEHQPHRVVSDLARGPELDDELRLLDENVSSYLCVPLTMWGQVMGALSLASNTPQAFRTQDAEFLTQIADHVAGAVWNALLYEVEQKRRHTADALVRLSSIINSTLELDEVLELALEQLERVITYNMASILLLDGGNLRIVANRGARHAESLIGKVFRVEENNISHQVMRTQQTRIIPDVQQIEQWGRNRDDIEAALIIRAWIGAPLIVRGQSIGLLAIDKFEPDFFTEEDGETAAAFATQIAIAIHNARLFQAIQEQRDRLTSILTDTTDAVIVLDHAYEVWLLNPAAERHLKIRRDQVIGQPVEALKLPELDAALATAHRTGEPVMSEIAGPDEKTAFHASIAPVHEVGWVIVMQDITPLKELDRLRTEWVAAVSHDLKNPIQVVQLGAALMEMDGPLNDLQLERIQIIQRSAEQLSDLVTGVLDLARLEAGPSLRLVTLRPSDIIATVLSEIGHLAVKNQQQLLTNAPPDLPPILGDAALLKRALANLVSNAIKYTPAEGSILVRAAAAGAHIQIDVIDDGQGIPADALPQLFDRFYRVPGTKAEGTGLGLSIVKSIVEKHHGTIEVESTLGKGSTFTITLPVAAQGDTA